MDSTAFLLVDSKTLVDSRLFSEVNVFCLLFSRRRRAFLLATSASRINYAPDPFLKDSSGNFTTNAKPDFLQ